MMRVYVSLIATIFVLVACQSETNRATKEFETFSQEISGSTQGTTYQIKMIQENHSVSKKSIDSLLHLFDLELSGYIPNSILSKINDNKINKIPENQEFFKACYVASQTISEETNGAFDATVLPLVKEWGFFKENYKMPKPIAIDSILEFVGYSNIQLQSNSILKKDLRTQLDFNSIAQGYAVDVVADFLISHGHKDFYVEIGGELFVSGTKENNEPWVLGIDVPSKSNLPGENRMVQSIIGVKNTKGVATSGDYRKTFEYQGKKYAHSINPKTGYPSDNNLRSVTIIAPNAMLADGYATAFMVMGTEASFHFLNNHPELDLEVYFIMENKNGIFIDTMTTGFSSYVLN